jgi:hypothetical protein
MSLNSSSSRALTMLLAYFAFARLGDVAGLCDVASLLRYRRLSFFA